MGLSLSAAAERSGVSEGAGAFAADCVLLLHAQTITEEGEGETPAHSELAPGLLIGNAMERNGALGAVKYRVNEHCCTVAAMTYWNLMQRNISDVVCENELIL